MKLFFKKLERTSKKIWCLTTNIGIHLFDFLILNFGNPIKSVIKNSNPTTAKGLFKFKNAKVDWLISVDNSKIPKNENSNSYRKMFIGKNVIDLSNNFTDLHTKSYEYIKKQGLWNRRSKRKFKAVRKIKKITKNKYFIHSSSILDKNVKIGSGTKIWHFCHISKNVI